MSRQNYTSGQEIVNSDLNDMSARTESDIYDRFCFEIMGRRSDAFFGSGFSQVRTSSNSLLIKSGMGFQNVGSASSEPAKQPLVLDVDVPITINTPDASNPRIDIVCVKAARYDSVVENRKFKDEFSESVSTQQTVSATDWKADVVYVAGDASGTPVVPDVPAGYLKICEILVSAALGIVDTSAITDTRNFLPVALGLAGTGNIEYDAIVGNVGVDQGANFDDLKSAVDNAVSGWKILVVQDQQLDAKIELNKNNIEIVCKRGITLFDNGAGTGIELSANDCRINNARFSGFTVTAASILNGATRNFFDVPRFSSCAGTIQDNGDQTFINLEYVE